MIDHMHDLSSQEGREEFAASLKNKIRDAVRAGACPLEGIRTLVFVVDPSYQTLQMLWSPKWACRAGRELDEGWAQFESIGSADLCAELDRFESRGELTFESIARFTAESDGRLKDVLSRLSRIGPFDRQPHLIGLFLRTPGIKGPELITFCGDGADPDVWPVIERRGQGPNKKDLRIHAFISFAPAEVVLYYPEGEVVPVGSNRPSSRISRRLSMSEIESAALDRENLEIKTKNETLRLHLGFHEPPVESELALITRAARKMFDLDPESSEQKPPADAPPIIGGTASLPADMRRELAAAFEVFLGRLSEHVRIRPDLKIGRLMIDFSYAQIRIAAPQSLAGIEGDVHVGADTGWSAYLNKHRQAAAQVASFTLYDVLKVPKEADLCALLEIQFIQRALDSKEFKAMTAGRLFVSGNASDFHACIANEEAPWAPYRIPFRDRSLFQERLLLETDRYDPWITAQALRNAPAAAELEAYAAAGVENAMRLAPEKLKKSIKNAKTASPVRDIFIGEYSKDLEPARKKELFKLAAEHLSLFHDYEFEVILWKTIFGESADASVHSIFQCLDSVNRKNRVSLYALEEFLDVFSSVEEFSAIAIRVFAESKEMPRGRSERAEKVARILGDMKQDLKSEILDEARHDARPLVDVGLEFSFSYPDYNTRASLNKFLEAFGALPQYRESVARSVLRNYKTKPFKDNFLLGLAADKILDAIGYDQEVIDAIGRNDLRVVAELIDKGRVALDARSRDQYRNALRYATTINNIDAVRLLFEKGAVADWKDPNDGAFLVASAHGTGEMVRLFIQMGARPTAAALYAATTSDNIDAFSVLVDCGADIREISGWGDDAPLHYAAKRGALKIVKKLLESGVDANMPDRHGRTALELIEKSFDPKIHTEIVETLREKGG